MTSFEGFTQGYQEIVQPGSGGGGATGPTGPTGPAGPTGPTGPTGPAGAAGVNAFTTTTADFAMPAVSGTVNVAVVDSTWIPVGETVFIETAGYLVVTATPDSTHVTVQNNGLPGNAAPATNIVTGAKVSPGGVQGATGATGATGPTGPTTRSVVATIAALQALDAATFAEGHEVFVVSLLDTFVLATTSLASDTSPGPYRVIAALNAPAGTKWVRRQDTAETWRRVTTWFFNNTTGNDENAGSTSITPLKTAEEFYRRTSGNCPNNCTFTIQDGNYSFDMPIHVPSPGISRARITVIGTPTQVATGSVASTTARSGNTSAQLTSAALSFAGLEGDILRMTSGAISGSICPIVSDLGANTAEIEPGFFSDPAGGSNGLPANGTTFEVLAPAQTISLATSLGVEATFKYFLASDRLQTPLFVMVGCKVSQLSTGLSQSASWSGRFVGCSFTASTTVQSSNAALTGCAVLDQINIACGSFLSAASCVGRKATPANAIFNVGNNDSSATGGQGAASITLSDVGLQGATNAAGLYVGAGGFAAITGDVYGSGSQYGVSAANGGKVQVAVGITNPTVTGTASDILLDGATSHIPPLQTGLVPQPASAMTTWAAWAAAPFSTNVVKYSTLTSLIKGV